MQHILISFIFTLRHILYRNGIFCLYKYIIKDLICLNNDQMENLLKITASRLGSTPEALKKAAESGDLGRILGENSPQTEKMRQVLSDPQAAQKLLSTPQAQKILNMLKDKK